MFENVEQTPTTTETKSYLEALVGEGKKYASVDELAKAYANADAKIMADAAELARAKELETELTITKNLLEQAVTRVPSKENQEVKPTTPVVTPISEEDLEARINKTLTERSDAERRSANQNVAAQRLVEVYGDVDKAKAAIATRASELGVSAKWLEDTAASSPNAFFATMNLPTGEPKPVETPAPKGTVNTTALQNINTPGIKPGTYRYYQELRKSDPKAYRSVTVQGQMHRDAIAKGADFYL